ncbi:MAG: dihydroneopterin aldolase [Candidatus Eremiobacteraeota bacterium]|nr:dihydroneopterin aldolase [Candidatus Eremiobacteraeota bacterium]
MDRISLRNIVAHGKHGANPGERDRAQPFHLEVDLDVDLSRAGLTDELHDTVDYAKVYETVVKIVEEKSFKLMERVASVILDEILRDPRIVRASLAIAKPDLLDGATPTVRLERNNRKR